MTAYPANNPMSALPDVPMPHGVDRATLSKVAMHCRMNSGTHFLDSGMANGRVWQSTPITLDEVIVDFSEWESNNGKQHQDLTVSVSVVLMFARIGLDDEVQSLLDNADTGDMSWFDHGRTVMEGNGWHCHARDNVYNHENDYDQVFVWEVWTRDEDEPDWIWADDAVMLVYPHTGADVRGGYAAPLALDVSGREGNYLENCVGLEPIDDFTREWLREHGDGEDRYCAGYTSTPVYDACSDLGRIVKADAEGVTFERATDTLPDGYTTQPPTPTEQIGFIKMEPLKHTDGLLRFAFYFSWE